MADIMDAGKAGIRTAVGKIDEGKKLPPLAAPPGADGAAIARDEIHFKKILWTPEDRARARLDQAESQIDREIAELDRAIADRTPGSWFRSLGDPQLAELRRARSELLKAKNDIEAARQALEGRIPLWKLAQAYLHPGIWNERQPDLARAEARLNSALGHMAHAEHCVREAIESGVVDVFPYREAKGGLGSASGSVEGERAGSTEIATRHPAIRSDGDLKRLLYDLDETRQNLEQAREDVWEAQERANRMPPRPFPEPMPWPAPFPRPFLPREGEPWLPTRPKWPPIDLLAVPYGSMYIDEKKSTEGQSQS